ncbi:MAG: LysM peptidoglycan-binding domain-containing protein [Clostridia bacterium]|nr:LysM peptidoglycan-binding domain-containing protein [Clostridia bacterium]
MKRYRIKSKLKFTAFLTLVIIFSVFITGAFFGFFDASSMDERTYKLITIQSGDTLWDLAKEFGPDDTDCRQVIYEICKLNNLTPETLWPGQEILIPQII